MPKAIELGQDEPPQVCPSADIVDGNHLATAIAAVLKDETIAHKKEELLTGWPCSMFAFLSPEEKLHKGRQQNEVYANRMSGLRGINLVFYCF